MEELKFKKYVCMKQNLKDRFMSDKSFGTAFCVDHNINGKLYEVATEEWWDTKTGNSFLIQNVEGIVDLFLIPENSGIFVNRDFLDVTNNPFYEIGSICNKCVIRTSTYIEGADGTGKTTAVNGLASRGVLTIDRCVEHITKIMNKNDREMIVQSVKAFLDSNPNTNVIFLYVSDRDEHYRRVFGREFVSNFDKMAFELQDKYLYTYEQLKHYENLYLVDTYNKTVKQVQDECEMIALGKTKEQEQDSTLG